jgi:hypothetical protein
MERIGVDVHIYIYIYIYIYSEIWKSMFAGVVQEVDEIIENIILYELSNS